MNILPSWSHVIGSCSIGINWICYTVGWKGQWTTGRGLSRFETDHKQELINDRTLKSTDRYIVWLSSDVWKSYFHAGLLWQMPDRNKLFSNDAFQCRTRNGWHDKQQRLVNLPGTNCGTNVSTVVNDWLQKSNAFTEPIECEYRFHQMQWPHWGCFEFWLRHKSGYTITKIPQSFFLKV